MKLGVFEKLASEFLHKEQILLFQKRRDYSGGEDCLSAFRSIAALTGVSLETACLVLLGKHLSGIIRQIAGESVSWTWEDDNGEGMKQHISDARNYLLLLAAILEERHGGQAAKGDTDGERPG